MLYLTDLLTETFADAEARDRAIETALGSLHLGETMRRWLGPMLHDVVAGGADRPT